MKSLFENKDIVNPMNPDEVFSCNDLVDDYKICRREKRLQTSTTGKKMNCTEFRQLGKFSLSILISPISRVFLFTANKCFY